MGSLAEPIETDELCRPIGDGIFRLTEEEVQEFQELVHRTSGVWIAPDLAAERANALLVLTRVIIGPLPEDVSFTGVRTSSPLPESARHPTLKI
jgi:hypothetical protein